MAIHISTTKPRKDKTPIEIERALFGPGATPTLVE